MKARLLQWKKDQNDNGLSSLEDYRKKALQTEQEKIRLENIEKSLAKLPARFRDKQFTDYKTNNARQERVKLISERFVQTFSARLEEGTNIRFIGNPGAGKTFLANLMSRALIENNYTVQYKPTLGFLRLLQEKRYKSSAEFEVLLKFYQGVQFLIIDEVTESTTKDGIPSVYEKKMLFEIVNSRYLLKQRCTLFISNVDNDEMIRRLGSPIVDRLKENGMTLVFDWSSWR